MKQIARSKGSTDTDTSRDYVYTDWEIVRRFAREFIEAAIPKACAAAGGHSDDTPAGTRHVEARTR